MAANIYTQTADEKYLQPLNAIMDTLFYQFFHNEEKIMTEAGCEPENSCTTDGLTFKSFTLRWLALTAQLVPSTADTIWPYIQASAKGAAGQCNGGDDGTTCGYHWTTTTYDGSTGVGQQMSALAAISANLITTQGLTAPLTLDSGAKSKQDPSLGSGEPTQSLSPVTTADKAGAWILTILILAFLSAGTYWLLVIEVD